MMNLARNILGESQKVIQRLQDNQLVSNEAEAQQRMNKMQDLGQLIQLGKGLIIVLTPRGFLVWLMN